MDIHGSPREERFPIGRVYVTVQASAAFRESSDELHTFLSRHARGDWGEAPERDRVANLIALEAGGPLRSTYRTAAGVILWVVTAADRSETCVLLADEV